MCKKSVLCIISILSAIYLMFIINEITLETNLQRVCVWGYFCLSLLGIIYFLKKYIYNFINMHKPVVLVLLIMTIIVFSFKGSEILPHHYIENHLNVTILDKKNTNSQGNEVWIKSIELDGEPQNIEDYADEQNGWKMNGDSLVGTLDTSKPLEMVLPSAKKITFIFGTHMWSGQVELKDAVSTNVYDLYSEDGGEMKIVLNGNKELYTGSLGELLKISTLVFLIMLEMIIGALYVMKKEKNMRKEIRQYR